MGIPKPLRSAIKRDCPLAVERVVADFGATILEQRRVCDGASALHVALASRPPRLVAAAACLRLGADPNARMSAGHTALHLLCAAAQHLNEAQAADLARALITHGADRDAHTREGDTALHLSIQEGQLHLMEQLLALGADPNAPGIRNEPPLHTAARRLQFDAFEPLLRAGATPNGFDERGISALHRCIWAGRQWPVERLIEAGADINSRSDDGDTALHRALYYGKHHIAHRLLEHGANPLYTDSNGLTPAQWLHLSRRTSARDIKLAEHLRSAARQWRLRPQRAPGTGPEAGEDPSPAL